MNDVVIRPLRFTADVEAMRAFLETLGLRSRIESERGGWVDMLTGRGMVALHDAASECTGGQPGQTSLTFEADKIDELKDRLEQRRVRRCDDLGRGVRPGPVGHRPGRGRALDRRAQQGSVRLQAAQTPAGRALVGHAVPDRSGRGGLAADSSSVLGSDRAVRFGPADAEFAVRLELTTTEDLDDVPAAGSAGTQ